MSMENPKISIIVPVYNTEKYLRRCLDSISAQTFTDWECICVDDGSPDDSGSILDEYAEKDGRFVIIHKENGGVSSARNAGLDIARGEWIAFCDSDDWVEKDWPEEQYTYTTGDDYDAVVCGLYGKGKPCCKVLKRKSAKKMIFIKNGFGGFSFLRLIKRRNVGDLRFDISISYLEDCDFFYRVFDNCNKILWTNKPLYHYERNNESVTNQTGLTPQARSGISGLERIINKENDRDLKNLVKTVRLAFYSDIFISYVFSYQIKLDGFEEVLVIIKENIFAILFSIGVIRMRRKILLILLLLNTNFEKNCFLQLWKRWKKNGAHI